MTPSSGGPAATDHVRAAAGEPPDGPAAIRIQNVSKTFGGVRALDDVDFEVAPGEVHCLAGENGCGKSTLIKIVTGVYEPDANSGTDVSYFGVAQGHVTPEAARRAGIAVIWQDLALFAEMTVAENIAFESLLGALPRPVRHAALLAKAKAALDSLGVDLPVEARLRELPIAARQLVAIARALAHEAKVIFMDEPTASLTQAETDSLLDIVRNLSARGVAIVFVSHRLAEVLEISSRVTVLRDGKLVGVYPTQGMTQSRLTELMTGQNFDAEVAARDRSAARPVLQLRGLTRRGEYRDVSLTIRAGEVLGLTGLIGAGRTELGHTLFGMTRADAGEILLEGTPVAFASNRQAISAGVAYVSEDRLSLGLIQPQSIADNVVMPVLRRITGASGLISERAKADLVRHWIDELSVKIGTPQDPVSTLSGGNQQRVVLSKWLATEPKLLILDAPTVGVDVGARAGIFRIVRRLAEQGLAILMISDEVPEVYFNADRVLHMADGRIVGEHDPRGVDLATLEDAVYG